MMTNIWQSKSSGLVLGRRPGGHLVPFYIHYMNQVNSRNGSAMMTAPIQGHREFRGIGAVSIPGQEFPGILKTSGLSKKFFCKILTKYSKIRLVICFCNLYHKSPQMHLPYTTGPAGQALPYYCTVIVTV